MDITEMEITEKQFNGIIKKVKRIKNSRLFNCGKYTSTFRYVMVKDNAGATQFLRLDPKANNDDVIQIVFDVVGLEKDYITQMSFTREKDGTFKLLYFPERKKELLDEFLDLFLNDLYLGCL